MFVNPKYREITGQDPPRPHAPSVATAPEPSGQVLSTCLRQNRDKPDEELRVTLDEYECHPYLSIRLWIKTEAGWAPSKKGVSVRMGEAQTVADALNTALSLAGPKKTRADRPARPNPAPHARKPSTLPGIPDRTPRETFDEFAEDN